VRDGTWSRDDERGGEHDEMSHGLLTKITSTLDARLIKFRTQLDF
jgi:hypothetical protein